MVTPTANIERERLLELAEEYREKGYEVSFHPALEELPGFLKNFRPDMIARRGDEAVVIEVKSRRSLNSSSQHLLRNIAQAVEQHPGWRFELVMTNPEDSLYLPKAESSLERDEIESGLQVAKQLAAQYPESAILYSWSLAEATLRLVAKNEGFSLPRLDALYLVKQLATEGVISRTEYNLLMDALSLRNAVAHGFKADQLTKESVYRLIDMTEQLLSSLFTDKDADSRTTAIGG